jgi:tetratricopeptide (TPR) repeat protein
VRVLSFEFFAILMWPAFAVTATASDETDGLRRAEQAFQEGLARRDNPQEARPYFQEAAQEYESLNQRGNGNPALFRNMGNAYLLANDLPRAILAYRRGLLLAPSDPVLQANLHFAREQVDYPSGDGFSRPHTDHWPPWLPRPTLLAMLAFAVFVYAVGLAFLTRWRMTRRSGLLVAGIVVVAIAVLPLGGVIHEARQQRQAAKYPLVVLAENRVPLRNGDGVAYPARHDGKTLNRGVEARLLFERGDWLNIELSGGETGWVPRTVVLLDTPGAN